MTITTIQVQGYHIAVEMSCSVPISEWKSFKRDLIDTISEMLSDGRIEGKEEMYYTEEALEGEYIETDVDVKWSVIDWKETATLLYEAWTTLTPGILKRAKEQYEKYNSYYGTEKDV